MFHFPGSICSQQNKSSDRLTICHVIGLCRIPKRTAASRNLTTLQTTMPYEGSDNRESSATKIGGLMAWLFISSVFYKPERAFEVSDDLGRRWISNC